MLNISLESCHPDIRYARGYGLPIHMSNQNWVNISLICSCTFRIKNILFPEYNYSQWHALVFSRLKNIPIYVCNSQFFAQNHAVFPRWVDGGHGDSVAKIKCSPNSEYLQFLWLGFLFKNSKSSKKVISQKKVLVQLLGHCCTIYPKVDLIFCFILLSITGVRIFIGHSKKYFDTTGDSKHWFRKDRIQKFN